MGSLGLLFSDSAYGDILTNVFAHLFTIRDRISTNQMSVDLNGRTCKGERWDLLEDSSVEAGSCSDARGRLSLPPPLYLTFTITPPDIPTPAADSSAHPQHISAPYLLTPSFNNTLPNALRSYYTQSDRNEGTIEWTMSAKSRWRCC
ncbi:hypothetical protein L202_00937 [Cryptococcus amylolentus CBS 6039]|uniref:Uncharacterized protein n=1 Tax=Cryptococcus amylolentus CBS 6039 TaxID=1295533 RepID=A0A1E3I269_9TREE|nr:hypothetical protein L202_00937 [Cryptococcus amylolentus CBS 6039]ODN82639.1 hypothetical protein L202_00937 [Cryptococcus amylolentus CBS 6039]